MQDSIESDVNDNETTTTYCTYDDGLLVRSMTSRDAEIVQDWYVGMGDISLCDLPVALSVFPRGGRGFYIGEFKGEVVASAIRIPWSPSVYYGSLYYVHKDYRRRGFGTRVRDQVAFGHVGQNMLAVDAVMDVVTTNENKFRYVAAFRTRRFKGIAPEVDKHDLQSNTTRIVLVDEVDFDDLVAYDNKCFIMPENPIRKEFMRKWVGLRDGATRVALNERGEITGFGCRRPCVAERTHLFGPVYADTRQVAEMLTKSLCVDIAGEWFLLECWEPNKASYDIAEQLKMHTEFDCVRMHVNGNPHEFKDTVYCVTSIDVCGF